MSTAHRLAPLALALTLGLSGCGGTDYQAMTCGEYDELADNEQVEVARHFMDERDVEDENGLAEDVADEIDGECGDDDAEVAGAAKDVLDYVEMLGG